MKENRDLEREMVDKGILVYDNEDNCYHVGKGYSADDVKKYVLKPKPKPKKTKKIKIVKGTKIDAIESFVKSAAKVMGVSEQVVKDRVRVGNLLTMYENGDCSSEEKEELTKLYNKLRKSHIKLIKS